MYNKQNFEDGQVLKAEHLNKMEDGIAKANSIIVSERADTLTWDGNTEGLVSVMDMLYKVSDATPTAEDIENGLFFATNVEESTDIHLQISEQFGLLMHYMMTLVIVPENMGGVFIDEIGVSFPEKGTYVVYDGSYSTVSITIPNYTGFAKETIKPEYLPEHKHSWNELPDKPLAMVSLDEATMSLSMTPAEIKTLIDAGTAVLCSSTMTPVEIETGIDGNLAGVSVSQITLGTSTSGGQVTVDGIICFVLKFDADGTFIGAGQKYISG